MLFFCAEKDLENRISLYQGLSLNRLTGMRCRGAVSGPLPAFDSNDVDMSKTQCFLTIIAQYLSNNPLIGSFVGLPVCLSYVYCHKGGGVGI